MTTLIQFSQHPAVHALGWTLLHFLWQGAIVAILLAAVLALLSGRSPQLRYVAACSALLLMIALPLLTWRDLIAAPQSVERPTPGAHLENNAGPNSRYGLSESTPWLDRMARELDYAVPWVIAIWIAGVILLLSRLNLGLIVAWRMTSRAIQPAAVELQRLLHDLSQRLGMARRIKLASSTAVQVPAVIGWLRPVILLPLGGLTGLSASQVEALLLHELAHIRRHDYLVNVLQSVVETLLFYHPATWWISKQIRKEREHCCDDFVIGMSGDPLAYAKALSFLEEHRSAIPSVALGANGGLLVMRIRRLLGCKETPAISRLAAIALLLATFTVTGLCIGAVARAESNTNGQPAAEGEAALKNLPHVYRQWLEQDVRWIIAPEERSSFLQLSGNEDRDHFIEQFWERRNPSPGSAENKFKEQHYQRIAYANMNFRAGIAGWKTDRGRVYIVYGPPDEKEVHPAGGHSANPTEIWHYRLIQDSDPTERRLAEGNPEYKTGPILNRKDVSLKFIDVCNCGDYRLQSPTN